MKIEIGDKEYQVKVAISEEDKIKGLQDIDSLPENEGMLFIYEEPQEVSFWMKDTKIPLDIIFINEDYEVISIYEAEPLNEDIATEENVKYVLEVNRNSEIEEGDELEIEDEEKKTMKVLDSNGETQMELEGGERLFSRKNTVTLIKMAKRADLHKEDKYYKALGKKVFKYLDIQDSNTPEYVQLDK